jgi:hypothetical protein
VVRCYVCRLSLSLSLSLTLAHVEQELWVRLASKRRVYLGLAAVPYHDGRCVFPAIAASYRAVVLAAPGVPAAAPSARPRSAAAAVPGRAARAERQCLLLRVAEEARIVARVLALRRVSLTELVM